MKLPSPLQAAIFALLALSNCAPREDPPPPDFTTHVKPILEAKCLPCHNTGTLLGKLNLENSTYVFSEKYGGPYILPGDPFSSKLFQVINLSEDSEKAMPPLKHRLSEAEIAIIQNWIFDGAPWPPGEPGKLIPVGTTPWQTESPTQF